MMIFIDWGSGQVWHMGVGMVALKLGGEIDTICQ
jgi:hypothetical protein